MAILSNINDKFRVDSAGAVYFGTSAGTNLQVLQSVGTTGSPTWVNVDDIIGGPYLPLTGGTLAGTGNLLVGGTLTVNGVTTLNAALTGTSATFIRDASGYALRLDSANATTDNDLRFAKGGVDYAAIQVSSAASSNFEFYVNDGTNWINTLNFARADGQAVFTKLVSGITPTAAANFATKAYVDAHPGSGGTVTSVGGTGSVSGITLTGTVTTTGNLTLGGTLSASITNISDAARWWNNFGDNHTTRTSFDASTASYGFGWRYVQGNTNGPGTGGTQFYSAYVGLGNDYPSTGTGSYGAYLAFDRGVTNPYLSIRYNENNALSTWRKISAGTADILTTARTIAGVSFNGSANISLNNNAITNGAGYITSFVDTTYSAGNGITFSGTPQTVINADINYISYSGTNNFIVYGTQNNEGTTIPTGSQIIYADAGSTQIISRGFVSDLPFTNNTGDLTSITLGNGLTGSSLTGPIPNILMSGSYTGKFTIDSTGDVEYLALNTTSTTNKRVRIQFTQNDDAGMEIGTDYSVDNSSNFYFYDRVAGSVMFFTSVASSFFPGSLRIGMTAASSQKLHVQGSNHFVTFENTSTTANHYAQILLKAGDRQSYIWTANQNSAGTWGGAGSLNIYTDQAGSSIAFFTQGDATNTKLMIEAGGSIGINKTTGLNAGGFGSPKLVIKQSVNSEWGGVNVEAASSDAVFAFGTTDDAHRISGSYRATAGYKPIYISTAGNIRMVLDTSGNVGIGNTSPGAKLVVGANVNSNASGIEVNAGAGGGNVLSNGTADNWFPYVDNNNYYSAQDHIFRSETNSSTRMTIKSSGNVGIGITLPVYKLHVVSSAPEAACFDTTSASYGAMNVFKAQGVIKGNAGYNAGSMYFGGEAGTNTIIQSGGQTGIYINSSTRYVGIGTISPQTTLQVNGAASGFAAHFGQGQNNSSGVFGGISLGYAENANALYRKVGIVAQAKGDNAARQDLHFLVDTSTDAQSAAIADSKMHIAYDTGNVIINNNLGIGVTSPTTAKLVVAGKVMLNNANVPNNLAELNIGWTGGGETRAIDIDGNWGAGESKSITFTHSTAATDMVGQINCQHNGPGSRIRWGKLYHSGNSSTYTMELISTSQTAANLTVAGNITATADVVAYSDERLKSNIKTLDGSKVLKMRGVSFEKEGKKGSGVIAQELEKIAPELVNNDNEYKGVAYGNLTGYLIEAIKELEARVKELENK